MSRRLALVLFACAQNAAPVPAPAIPVPPEQWFPPKNEARMGRFVVIGTSARAWIMLRDAADVPLSLVRAASSDSGVSFWFRTQPHARLHGFSGTGWHALRQRRGEGVYKISRRRLNRGRGSGVVEARDGKLWSDALIDVQPYKDDSDPVIRWGGPGAGECATSSECRLVHGILCDLAWASNRMPVCKQGAACKLQAHECAAFVAAARSAGGAALEINEDPGRQGNPNNPPRRRR